MGSDGDNYVELAVTYLRHTDKAIMINDGDKDHWLPLSRTNYDGDLDELAQGQHITIETQEWIAYDKGLI